MGHSLPSPESPLAPEHSKQRSKQEFYCQDTEIYSLEQKEDDSVLCKNRRHSSALELSALCSSHGCCYNGDLIFGSPQDSHLNEKVQDKWNSASAKKGKPKFRMGFHPLSFRHEL